MDAGMNQDQVPEDVAIEEEHSLSPALLIAGLIGAAILAVIFTGAHERFFALFPQSDEEQHEAVLALEPAFRQGMHEEVIREGEQLLERNPEHVPLLRMLGASYYYGGVPAGDPSMGERAFELLTKALSLQEEPDISLLHNIYNAATFGMRYEEGIALLESTFEAYPDMRTSDLVVDLAILYDQKGDIDTAERLYAEALQENDLVRRANAYLSRIAAGRGDWEEVRDYALRETEIAEGNGFEPSPFALAMLAEGYHLLGEDELAWDTIEHAWRLYPEHAGVRHIRANILMESHRGDETIYHSEGLAEAVALNEELIADHPLFSHAYHHLGIAYWLTDQHERARAAWRTGLEILPRDTYFPAWAKPHFEHDFEEALMNPEQFSL